MPADGLTPSGTRASAGAVVTKFGSRLFSVPELRWLAYCGMNKNTEIMQATFSKSFSLIKVSVFVPMDKPCNVDNLITKLFKLIIYPYHQKHNKSLAYHMRCTVIYPGPTFIKPDQRNPWIKDQLWNDLLSTILHLQLLNFVSCGRDKPSHMTQNLVTVGVKL